MHGRLVVLVAVAMVGLAVPAAQAGATAPSGVRCGQVVTTDVVLHADLNCTGDALVIGASDVTVRLRGHTITSTDGTGDGIRVGVPATTTTPAVCADDVTVTGGTIAGFAAGVGATACPNPTTEHVSSMTLTGNTWGISAQGVVPEIFVQPVVVDVGDSTIVGPNGIGPYCPQCVSGQAQVTSSKIDVTSPDGISIAAELTPSSVESSELRGGTLLTYGVETVISDSRLTGLTMDCLFGGTLGVLDSRVTGGGIPQSTGACQDLLSGDRFVGSGSGVGVVLSTGGGTVTDTAFTGWTTAVEIGDQAVITGSTFRGDGTGVTCDPSSPCLGGLGDRVSGNTFRDNWGTGLLLDSGLWHVGSNVAIRNGGLGIDVVDAIDDGGNVARHNLPPQCIGVVCTT